jgi:hypothetical protein
VFESSSRYYNLETYVVTDHRGRPVAVVPVPAPPGDPLLGIHVRREGERLDHLAARYLADPTGFWRIAEMNGVMVVEALSEVTEVAIPAARR